MPRTKRKNIKKEKDSEPEEYEVERIVDHRIIYENNEKPVLEYFLKWKNYSTKDNTWEPSEAVNANDLIEEYWELHGGKTGREKVTKELEEYESTKKRKVVKEEDTTQDINQFYESESDIDFVESDLEDDQFRIKSSWTEVHKVEAVRPGDDEQDKKLYAVIRWSDGKLAKYPTSVVAKKSPLKLIEYYEKRLLFEQEKN